MQAYQQKSLLASSSSFRRQSATGFLNRIEVEVLCGRKR